MVEAATLLSAADDYPLAALPGRKFRAVAVEEDGVIPAVERAVARRRGNAEPGAAIEDFCGLFAEINRKFVSACESHAIELRYPQGPARLTRWNASHSLRAVFWRAQDESSCARQAGR
jgi:hypothetical protein